MPDQTRIGLESFFHSRIPNAQDFCVHWELPSEGVVRTSPKLRDQGPSPHFFFQRIAIHGVWELSLEPLRPWVCVSPGPSDHPPFPAPPLPPPLPAAPVSPAPCCCCCCWGAGRGFSICWRWSETRAHPQVHLTRFMSIRRPWVFVFSLSL